MRVHSMETPIMVLYSIICNIESIFSILFEENAGYNKNRDKSGSNIEEAEKWISH